MNAILFYIVMVSCLFTYTDIYTNYNYKKQVLSDKVLMVPYKVQPDKKTCQSACVKMYCMYKNIKCDDNIYNIYDTINFSPIRPNKKDTNAWVNIVWYLNRVSNSNKFQIKTEADDLKAIEFIVNKLDQDSPVILSTVHSRSKGHFIIVVGYKNYKKNVSTPNFTFICHDPFGKFNPQLESTLWGEKRFDYGVSFPNGSEKGVGMGVEITPNNLKRLKGTKINSEYFAMITSE